MGELQQVADLDRLLVIKVLMTKGMSYSEMIPTLTGLGLIECEKSHRMRSTSEGQVCATCEHKVGETWRRYLKQLGSKDLDLDEIKGAWLTVHMIVDDICRKRYVQDVEITTTRTETVDGKEITTTTVRRERRINSHLLRLSLEVQDKVMRFAGVDLDDPASLDPVPRAKVHVNRHDSRSVN